MAISFRQELKLITAELRERFLTVSLDWGAPLRLLEPFNRTRWRPDLVGGLAVSVMAIPQALAYAIIAGVPPIMGLYGLVFVGLLSGLWCYSAHLNCGPTNAASLMLLMVLLARPPGSDPVTQVALIALVMGVFQIVAAVLGVGGLTKFISRSVIVGYLAATGVLIFFGQIPNLIGTRVDAGASLFARVWISFRTIPSAHLPSLLIAVATFLAMAMARRWLKWLPAGFAAIVGGSLYAWALRTADSEMTVKLVGHVQRIPFGLPALVMPSFNLGAFYDMTGPAIALGLLACIEVSTISKSLAMRTGDRTKPNQDILGLGLGNAVGAFFGAMPGSGSFTRSEFGYRCGVRSRWGAVGCAACALVVVVFCGRLIEQIPIPTLAALICTISLQMIDFKNARIALTATHSDALVFLTTFSAALFLRLDSAIYLGMLVSMGLFLQKASVPKLMEFEFDETGQFRPAAERGPSAAPQIAIVHVEGELFFGAAESIQDEILRTVERGRTKVIILRLRNAHNLDASGVMVLEQLIRDLRQLDIHVLISGTSPEVDRVIERSGLDRFIGVDNYFPSQNNFLEATRRAMKRGQEIVGAGAEIKLYYDQDMEKQRTASRPAPSTTVT